MAKIEVRKAIALFMAMAYVVFTGYCTITNKEMSSSFSAIVGSIMGYYFGKSTALDTPKTGA